MKNKFLNFNNNRFNQADDYKYMSQNRSEGESKFCTNCGNKIESTSNFCAYCGTPVIRKVNNTTYTYPDSPPREECAGTILRCPSCGADLSSFSPICPYCGVHISTSRVNKTVSNLKAELMQLENMRSNKPSLLSLYVADPVDEKKLALIKSFPIPNSIDEILEVEMLACANIDVSLSKNTLYNHCLSSVKTVENKGTISRSLSDAWVLKLQQAYQKAELCFKKDPMFEQAKKIYIEKMKELKITVKD